MIKIYRFSKSGFKSQYQDHLFNHYNFTFSEKDLDKFNEHQKKLILSSLEEKNDPDFDFNGVFAFIQKPTIKDYHYFLNHLSIKPDYTNDFHSIYLNPNIICYIDDGFCYLLKNKITLKEAFDKNVLTIYIPSYSLNNSILS